MTFAVTRTLFALLLLSSPLERPDSELEVKLEIGEPYGLVTALREMTTLGGYSMEFLEEKLVRDYYFDDDELTLFYSQISFRARDAKGRLKLDLKKKTAVFDGVWERIELTEDLPFGTLTDFVDGTGWEMAGLYGTLRAWVGDIRLKPRILVQDLRSMFILGDGVFLLTIDSASATDLQSTSDHRRFFELELELMGARTEENEQELRRLMEVIIRSFPGAELRASTRSKYQRGVELVLLGKGGGR